jgi:hypothetical protein
VALPAGAAAALLLIAGFGDWHGGRCLGPRYLIFALPLVGIGAALMIQRLDAWRFGAPALGALAGLALSSLALSLAGHLGFAHVSHRIDNPLFEVVLPVLFEGGPGPTVWDWIAPGGATIAAVCALALVTLLAGTWWVARRPRPTPAGPALPGGRLVIPLALAAAAVLHLALATLPTTPGVQGRRRVLGERAFAHEMLGQKAAARRVREARHRLRRPRRLRRR